MNRIPPPLSPASPSPPYQSLYPLVLARMYVLFMPRGVGREGTLSHTVGIRQLTSLLPRCRRTTVTPQPEQNAHDDNDRNKIDDHHDDDVATTMTMAMMMIIMLLMSKANDDSGELHNSNEPGYGVQITGATTWR